MAVLTGATNVNENGTATGDVTTDSTTITRFTYVDRLNVVTGPVAIAPGALGTTVLTRYGTLTVHQDGTYSYTADAPLAEALDTGDSVNDIFFYDFGDPTPIDDGSTTIVIGGVNDAPVAVPNTYTIAEDSGPFTQAAPGYLGNDTDVDDLTAYPFLYSPTLNSGPLHGTWTNNLQDGTFTYTPDANYFGTDRVIVTISDGESFVSETINFVITAVDDPYVAVDDGSDPGAPGGTPGVDFFPFYTFNEDTTATHNISELLANDSNPDGDEIIVDSISNLFDSVSGLQIGTIAYNSTTGDFIITPGANYNGQAFFDYVARDTNGTADPVVGDDTLDTGRVYVTVASVNDAPVSGGAQANSETEDQDNTFTLPAASDLQGGAPNENNAITYNLVAGTVQRNGVTIADGNITVNGAGTYEYNGQAGDQNLDTSESNVITFQYTANDANASAPATVTLTINGVNDAPVVVDDFFIGAEDTTLPASASRNLITGAGETPAGGADTDVDVEPLTAVASSGTSTGGGTYQVFTDGTFSYTPAADYNGNDTFVYQVSDGTAISAPGTVTIAVSPSPDAPVAVDDGTYNVTEDVPGQAVGLAPGGAAFRTNANGFFTEASLLANDTDPDGTVNDITSVGAAEGGTVTLYTSPGGTQYVVFTPFANYSGPAGFDYAVTDPTGNSDIGHVTLAVQEASDGGPVAVDDALSGTEQTVLHITAAQLLANDSDPDNTGSGVGTDQLTIRAIQNIQNATLSNVVTDANGNIISFDLTSISDVSGVNASFDYVVDDSAARTGFVGDTAAPGGIGGTRVVGVPDTRSGTDIGSVVVTLTNVNDTPDAVNDTLPGTTEDSSVGVTFTAAQLLANDHDADNAGNTNAGLTATIPNVANGGTITNNGNGTYTFIPTPNFNGNATFNYTVTDAGGLSDTATVTIPVASVNDAPVAVDDTLTRTTDISRPLIAEDRSSTFDWSMLLANDSDIDGGPLVITGATSPSGTITVDNATQTITYTPNPGFLGATTLTYTVSDGLGGTDTGVATFTVLNNQPLSNGDNTYAAPAGSGGELIFGNDGNDTITGTPNIDELNGDGGNDTLNGLAGADRIRTGTGNDTVNAGDGDDFVYADATGTKTINGDAGNDATYFGAFLDSTDSNNGGTGNNVLAIRGDGVAYENNFILPTSALVNTQTLVLLSGSTAPPGTPPAPAPQTWAVTDADYDLITQDSNVPAGGNLRVVANTLLASENLAFDGSNESNGSFSIFTGMGVDTLLGGNGNDRFFFGAGGTVPAFTGADSVNGGAGVDSIGLRGDYSGGLFLTSGEVRNVEGIAFFSGNKTTQGGVIVGDLDYTLTLGNSVVEAGKNLVFEARELTSGEDVTLNLGLETDGTFTIFLGDGNDNVEGGQLGDQIFGSLGRDTLDGNGGNDVFVYQNVAELSGFDNFDTIDDFDTVTEADRLDFNFGQPNAINTVTVVTVASLPTDNFLNQFEIAMGNAVNGDLAAGSDAVFVEDLSTGDTFLVVDNGDNVYTPGSDYLILFTDAVEPFQPSSEYFL